MRPALRYVAALAAPQLIGKLIEVILTSKWGRPVVASSMGPAAADTGRGAQVISHYAKLVSGLLLVAVNRWQDQQGDETLSARLARVDRLGWFRYISEVLLGLGALFRTATEFLEETNRLRSGRGI